jgi:hypothetical protein
LYIQSEEHSQIFYRAFKYTTFTGIIDFIAFFKIVHILRDCKGNVKHFHYSPGQALKIPEF